MKSPAIVAARLYARRAKAIVVPFKADSAFAPTPNDCHANVHHWCELHKDYRILRGWLVGDYSEIGHFRFYSHSIVEDSAGNRFDVTRPARLPFLETEATEECYVAFVTAHNLMWLQHPILEP